jgi:serine/threonine-protein kinase
MTDNLLGNRYEIIEKIGAGGMALVYKARCRLLNRLVAVKILRPEFTEDEEFISRFNVESQAAASLSHSNIVSVYDVGHQEDIHYIVMEYIKGITLKELIIEKGVLDWKEALSYSEQICSALVHAHKMNIIHRDIKPHNIMVTEEGKVKVTDFGIARAATAATTTLGGNTIGSVHYFSPEQAKGGYTDEKSDIYSLGIVMYEMLTGKVPFDGNSPVSVAMKHINDEPELPSRINGEIPIAIQSIILKAIDKEQSCRYSSANEMLKDLYRAFENPDDDFIETISTDECPTKKIPLINNIESGGTVNKGKGKKKKVIKKEDRVAVIAAMITSFVIIGIISVIGFNMFKDYLFPPNEIAVPDFVGEDIEKVLDKYDKSDFKIIEVQNIHNNEFEEGEIISQDPPADMMVKLPVDIEVTVSAGPKMVKVPDAVNKDSRQAEILMRQKDLGYRFIYENDDRVPTGFVIKQNPEPGQEVKSNEIVNVYVSEGRKIKMIVIPDLSNSTETEARNRISQLGLKIGNTRRENNEAEKNKVIGQSLQSGREVEENTTIDLVISDGPKTETVAGTKPKEYERKISVYLPQDKDNVAVKIVMESGGTSKVAYQRTHKKDDSPVEVTLKGRGTAQIQVYFDNELRGEDVVHFGGDEE